MSKIIARVPSGEVVNMWSALACRLEPHLLKTDGRMRVEDVFRLVSSGEWSLWVIGEAGAPAPDAFIAMSVKTEPSGIKSAVLEFMVGENRKEWLPHIHKIETWALELGCARIQMLVPKVFARDLQEYRLSHVFLEKALM